MLPAWPAVPVRRPLALQTRSASLRLAQQARQRCKSAAEAAKPLRTGGNCGGAPVRAEQPDRSSSSASPHMPSSSRAAAAISFTMSTPESRRQRSGAESARSCATISPSMRASHAPAHRPKSSVLTKAQLRHDGKSTVGGSPTLRSATVEAWADVAEGTTWGAASWVAWRRGAKGGGRRMSALAAALNGTCSSAGSPPGRGDGPA